jgi:outer membrane protein OmpA-like peptidoglycan-associated protein
MTHRLQEILDREKQLRDSRACASDGRPLARLVFFEPDSWLLPDGYEALLAAHAAYLRANPHLTAVVSGHSYGSGSHRFFWLMGDRRALAVQHKLVLAGVRPQQLKVQSKGAARSSVVVVGKEFGCYRRRVAIDYLDKSAAAPAQPGSTEWWRGVFGGSQRFGGAASASW